MPLHLVVEAVFANREPAAMAQLGLCKAEVFHQCYRLAAEVVVQLDCSKLAHCHLVVVELAYPLLCRLVRPQG